MAHHRPSDTPYTGARSVAGNTFSTGAFGGCSPSAYTTAVKADNPVLYYRLGEASGSTAADAATTPHNGTYQPGVTLGQGGAIRCDTDTAAGFNGTTGYVSNPTQLVNPQVYSLEAWFKTTTTTGGKIIGFGNAVTGASTTYDRHIYLTSTGQLIFGVYPSQVVTVTSPAAYNDGAWHQVDATIGPAGMALYVDATLVASNPNTVSQVYNGYWRVGYDNLAGWTSIPTSSYFKGTLDEVAVYPTTLTAGQITAHRTANN